MSEIKHPTQTTYYIVWHESDFHYGIVEPKQVMTSGIPNLWITENKQEWVDKLLNDYNVTIENKII